MRAHANDAVRPPDTPEWSADWAEMEPARDKYRRCWYCGSIHPDDLLEVLNAGATLEPTDEKYGWPHKLYVHGVPNELAGQIVRCGTNFDKTPIMAEAPSEAVIKFYTVHLVDAEDGILDALVETIHKQTDVDFKVNDGRVVYRRLPYLSAD